MKNRHILIPGDLLTLSLITIIGFASHGEIGLSYLPRMGATFLPLSIMWFLIAPRLGLFQNEIVQNARQLWRPLFVMFFAGPLAALLRGYILGSPVIPVFVLVLSLTSALGLILWRFLYYFFNRHGG